MKAVLPQAFRGRAPISMATLLPQPALCALLALLPPLSAPLAAAQPSTTPPSGSSSPSPSHSPARLQTSPLAGTTWQLVALQSMDDAIGRRTPPNPAAYTLRFGTDGTAHLRLDCNRGRAPWQATSAQAGSVQPGTGQTRTAQPSAAPPHRAPPSQGVAPKEVSGSLRFGPLALTRALCPPPSLSDTVARQLPFVRSFLLRHNRLYLSLMADGGILEWQPLPGVPFRAVLSPEERQAILGALDAATRRELAREPRQNRVVVARLDLNADGREELFAYWMGPLFCGTGGCTLQLFTPGPGSPAGARVGPASGAGMRAASGAAAGSGTPAEGTTGPGEWRLMQTFPITRVPLIAAPTTSHGWRDLWRPEAGGGAPASLVRERFDGQRYRPSERRAPQPTPTGTAVLVGDPVLADGAPL